MKTAFNMYRPKCVCYRNLFSSHNKRNSLTSKHLSV